jgi:hypothetical protein
VTGITKIRCPPERDEDVMRSFANDGRRSRITGSNGTENLVMGLSFSLNVQ